MTRRETPSTSQRSGNASARRRANERTRNRRIVQASLFAGLVLAVGLGSWWFSRGGDAPAGAALYQFQTPDVHSLIFDLTDEDTLYFGSHAGPHLSRDAGITWEVGTLRNTDAMQQSMAGGDTPRHYIAGHDVFMVSVDGGNSWRPQPNDLPSLDLHTFAGSPSDPDRLYAVPAGMELWTSRNGGETWIEATMPSTAATQPVSLSVAPDVPERVYLACGGEISVSDDGGLTWQNTPGPPGIVYAIAVAANSSETLYAGTNQGLFRRHAGADWERMSLDASSDILAVAISPVQPQRVAVVDADGKVYRSDAGGISWVE